MPIRQAVAVLLISGINVVQLLVFLLLALFVGMGQFNQENNSITEKALDILQIARLILATIAEESPQHVFRRNLVCGDKTIELGESCDDGSKNNDMDVAKTASLSWDISALLVRPIFSLLLDIHPKVYNSSNIWIKYQIYPYQYMKIK